MGTAIGDLVAFHAYLTEFARAMASPPTVGRHVNVLEHMLGYFRTTLDDGSRAGLRSAIRRFADGVVPLSVPLALFAHHVRESNVAYLAGQTYLRPHLDARAPNGAAARA